jgi:hypothetical protein
MFSAAFVSWTSHAADPGDQTAVPAVSSFPPDTNTYSRPAVSNDLTASGAKGLSTPGFLVVDIPNSGGGEPDIAINPVHPNEIVVHAGFGGWDGNAPNFVSQDGGLTWTPRNQIPPPPGAPNTSGCPCDITQDWGLNGILYGAYLTGNTDVFSASTGNPFTNPFGYFLIAANAQLTDFNGTLGAADQPWLLTNPDPTTPAQTDTYVAYDDFTTTKVRVSAAPNSSPPNFTADNVVAPFTGGGINPGSRLAVDPRTGAIYSLWQNCTANCGGSPKTIGYQLNRSLDAGLTWKLNGSAIGINVASGVTVQPTPKFGTVNALLGGIDHAAVDPTTSAVYVVYGAANGSASQGLLIPTNAIIGAPHQVSPPGLQAALPAVAVAPNGTVGVLYTSFDRFDVNGFPIFSGHFAFSTDQGMTFTDQTLLTFLSPALSDDPPLNNDRQRVLGDYQQLKVVGGTFYGAVTGNGAALGGPTANNDAIFFKVTLAPQINLNINPVDIGPVCLRSTGSKELQVSNTGPKDLLVTSITRTSGSTDISLASGPIFPVDISPDAHFDFTFLCSPTTVGVKTATFTIASNDPTNPNTLVTTTCTGESGKINVTGSGDFGTQSCSLTPPIQQTLKINNVGPCNLNVASAVISCADFTLVNPNEFPATISADSSLDVGVKFTPTSAGPKACNLTITSDDPINPVLIIPLTGNTQTGSSSLSVPVGLTLPPTVAQTNAACSSTLGVPIKNNGACSVKITNVALSGANQADYSLTGVPTLPTTIPADHQLGEGGLNTVFAPLAPIRTSVASVDVTFENDPITHALATDHIPLCGEGDNRGVRVLVTQGGVPVPVVKSIKLQKATAPEQNSSIFLNTRLKNVPLTTITGVAPCASYQFHAEFGGPSNPQLKEGTYRVVVKLKGFKAKTVRFNVETCTFSPMIVVAF